MNTSEKYIEHERYILRVFLVLCSFNILLAVTDSEYFEVMSYLCIIYLIAWVSGVTSEVLKKLLCYLS